MPTPKSNIERIKDTYRDNFLKRIITFRAFSQNSPINKNGKAIPAEKLAKSIKEPLRSCVVAAYVKIAPRTGPIQGDQPKEKDIPIKKGPKIGKERTKYGLLSL